MMDMEHCGEERTLDSLYAWIDTISLSRPKKNISRDFADGVLVAEVVANFLPKLVDLHNYCPASSWSQKKINWQTLNRRVLSKIGYRVADDIISQLIDAKPGVIEQVLWDIRHKIEQTTCNSDGKLNVQRRSKSYGHSKPQNSCIQLSRGNPGFKSPGGTPISTTASINNCSHNNICTTNDDPPLTYRVLNGINSPARCKAKQEEYLHSSESPYRLSSNNTSPTNNNNNNSNGNVTRSSTATISSKSGYISPKTGKYESPIVGAGSVYESTTGNNNLNVGTAESPPKGKISTTSPSQFGQGFLVNSVNHQGQGYIAPPSSNQLSSSLSLSNGPVVLSPVMDKQDNNNAVGPPAQIIYRGHKMIPLQFLDDKEKEIKALETSNRTLTLKIHRLEALVNFKDQRIEDLTHQLQNIRSMYERITDNSYEKL